MFTEEPHFLEGESPTNLNCTDGDDVSIRCNTDAEPEAEIVWLRNGEPLNCELGITEKLYQRNILQYNMQWSLEFRSTCSRKKYQFDMQLSLHFMTICSN